MVDSETGGESEIYIDSGIARQYAENLGAIAAILGRRLPPVRRAHDHADRRGFGKFNGRIGSHSTARPGMIPFLTYPLALIGLAALPGAGGDLHFAESLSPPAGFQPCSVAFSCAIQGRRRQSPSPATAAAVFSRTARACPARHRRHRAAMETAAIRAVRSLSCWTIRFPCAPSTRRHFRADPRQRFPGKTFPPPAAAFHAVDSGRNRTAFARRDRRKLARSGRIAAAMEMLVAQSPRSIPPSRSPPNSANSRRTFSSLTDHKPPTRKISNPRLEWRAFGEPLDNFAIVNASRTAFGRPGPLPARNRQFFRRALAPRGLLVQTGTNAAQASLVSHRRPHESQRLVFNIPSSAPCSARHAGA